MRKSIRAFALAGLCAAALSLTAGQVVEEIVAVVNDDVITLSQYKKEFDETVQSLRAAVQGEEFDKQYEWVKKELLNLMITDLLLVQRAREKNLNVSEQVKGYIENIKEQNNIKTADELLRALQQQGVDYDQFVKRIEEDMLKQAEVYSEVDRNIVLDDSESIAYYKQHPAEFTELEEYKVRGIYLAIEGKTAADLDAKKAEIESKVKAGEPFNALAALYSEGPAKEAEGDLGTFKKGELDTTLEQAVAALKAGETGGWVETKNGWYLLKLEEKKESRLKPFDEVKKEVEERIYAGIKQKKLEEYIKTLKEKSYIKILNPNPLAL